MQPLLIMRENTSSSNKNINNSFDNNAVNGELRRGPWTLDEDNLLICYVNHHGEGHWNLLASQSGLKRTGKSCRLRWLNYLKPDVKRGNFTAQEQILILQLHAKWGNRWSKIAHHLPGRTDNEIKNYWRTRVQKQARHLKVDANSTAFQDIIRQLWMPRLLQQIDNNNSPSSSSTNPTVPNHHLQPLNDPSRQTPSAHFDNYMIEDIQNFDHNQELNSSDLDQTGSNSSYISGYSSGSLNISSPNFHSTSTIGNTNNFPEDFSYVDNNFYDMEMQAQGDFSNTLTYSRVADSNWFGYNQLDDGTWNMDELWQFRNSSLNIV